MSHLVIQSLVGEGICRELITKEIANHSLGIGNGIEHFFS